MGRDSGKVHSKFCIPFQKNGKARLGGAFTYIYTRSNFLLEQLQPAQVDADPSE